MGDTELTFADLNYDSLLSCGVCRRREEVVVVRLKEYQACVALCNLLGEMAQSEDASSNQVIIPCVHVSTRSICG
jgi:hypothetical protein